MHRRDDIYFNFDAIPFIQYKEGEFLSSDILNEDGTAKSDSLIDAFTIYNNYHTIEVSQKGFGPSAKFGFSIEVENYEDVLSGFALEYNASILYGYSLIDN